MGNALGPFGWCVGAAILFGASTPLCKPLLEYLSPLCLAGCLYAGAGLVTLPTSLAQKGDTPSTNGDRMRLAGAVLFGGLLGPVFLLMGLSQEDAGNVSLLLNLETTATVFLGWLIFREKTTIGLWCAACFIVLGGFLLNIPFDIGSFKASGLVFLACLAWGFDNHFTADIRDFSPFQVTCIKGLAAGGINLALALWWSDRPPFIWVTWGLILGAITYGGSLVLYVAAARRIGASRSQLIFASAPYWGLCLAWLTLGEVMTGYHVMAIALMLTALVLVSRNSTVQEDGSDMHIHRHWHRHGQSPHDHAHPHNMWSIFGWHIHAHHHTDQDGDDTSQHG